MLLKWQQLPACENSELAYEIQQVFPPFPLEDKISLEVGTSNQNLLRKPVMWETTSISTKIRGTKVTPREHKFKPEEVDSSELVVLDPK